MFIYYWKPRRIITLGYPLFSPVSIEIKFIKVKSDIIKIKGILTSFDISDSSQMNHEWSADGLIKKGKILWMIRPTRPEPPRYFLESDDGGVRFTCIEEANMATVKFIKGKLTRFIKRAYPKLTV